MFDNPSKLIVSVCAAITASTVEEKLCTGYADCSQLNAYCTYSDFNLTTFTVVNKCKCVPGFEHVIGLEEYTATDSNSYTSECGHVSGERL